VFPLAPSGARGVGRIPFSIDFAMGTPYPLRPGEPDCRDFLRTGRCKYGESCKYNHPSNVEVGGGVKPMNPTEPLYPVRPGEPPCQYYLKHGTCKFGQSCKFNHPTGSPVNMGDGGGSNGLPTGFVFLTTNGTGASIQAGDSIAHHVMGAQTVQILPQRPNEPNCIYFLRNGRCKYGATCKFHHPLEAVSRNQMQQQHFQNSNTRPRDRSQSFGSTGDVRTQPQNVSYGQSARLQPITERDMPKQPTHILLPDGQIALILDPQSLQNVSELNAQDRPKFFLSQSNSSVGVQSMQSRDQNSAVLSPMLTATSASSSHQTLESNIDLWSGNLSTQWQGSSNHLRNQGQSNGQPPQNFQTISYSKPTTEFDNRSGSGGSLSAYGSVDSGQPLPGDYNTAQRQYHQDQVQAMPQPKSWSLESNEADQSYQQQARRDEYRTRAASAGSVVDHSANSYWPSAGSLSRQANGNRSDNIDVGLPVYDQSSYRPSAPTSLAAAAAALSNQGVNRTYSYERHSSLSPPTPPDRMRYSGPADQNLERRRREEEASGDDDGLSMMTSALLTMMDRHSPAEDSQPNGQRPPQHSQTLSPHTEGGYYYSEPNMQGKSSPLRQLAPPPGMSNPNNRAPLAMNGSRSSSSYQRQEIERPRSTSTEKYDHRDYPQATSWSPSWVDSDGSRY